MPLSLALRAKTTDAITEFGSEKFTGYINKADHNVSYYTAIDGRFSTSSLEIMLQVVVVTDGLFTHCN